MTEDCLKISTSDHDICKYFRSSIFPNLDINNENEYLNTAPATRSFPGRQTGVTELSNLMGVFEYNKQTSLLMSLSL